MLPSVEVPVEVLMGEAGICPYYVLLAVAWVYSRNPVMYGWSDHTDPIADFLAANYWKMSDPSLGASFIFSYQDLKTEKVQKLIIKLGREPRADYPCRSGLGLVFY